MQISQTGPSVSMRYLSIILLLWAGLFLVTETSGCYRASVRQSIRQATRGVRQPTRILADYQPWFGYPEHINVGYSTQDPAVLHKQIQKAKQMGIYGFAVDWYGERQPFEDRSYALLEQVARDDHFHVCLMYDETEEDNGHATDETLEAFEKAYRDYIGPDAPARQAYVTYDGHPIIFVFPKRGNTDWDRVRQAVQQWVNPPILLYKDDPPPQYEKDFDGYYAWVHPDQAWDPKGGDWGKQYLEHFYVGMKEHPGKIIVGAAWPGFNDSKASWSLNRHIDRRCGQTFEDTLRIFHQYDSEHPIPFLLIATWNDYEEGTQIENGVSDCPAGEKTQVAQRQ